MKQLFGILILLALTACKKDKTPEPEPTPAPTKWELIPGHYKVFDTLGNYIYEMDISHSIGASVNGYRVDSLRFSKLDGNFDLVVAQNAGSFYVNSITIGAHSEIHDSIDNRWNIFDLGSDGNFNTFKNDTIIFYFEKQNMPYWWNDGTSFFQGNLKHIAVKQ